MNFIKTIFLLTAMTVLLVVIGKFLGGTGGMAIALLFAFGINFVSYWWSDKIVLKMYNAKQIDSASAPQLYRTVEDLARRGNIPTPKIFVIDNETPNAFATGRNPEHASIAVTTGIVKLLNESELRGVIAHELAHIKNRDILLATVAATVAGAITMIANIAQWGLIFGRGDDDDSGGLVGSLVMIIVAPIAATLIQLAISRSREYVADETGAKMCSNSMGLASALEKLTYLNNDAPIEDARPATAHLFIVNPLKTGGITNLFSTHPPLAERVQRLRKLDINR